uniref:Uncharacterized protein n=1 Tax=Anopheles farauti TaxID=69004 RepID=A0A182QBJ1_9DIPT
MKLKCPSPLCLASESENRLRTQLANCDCLSAAGLKDYKSEVYGNVNTCEPGSTGSGEGAKKSTRQRSVSFLKRLGSNILHNLGPGSTASTRAAHHHQVYRAFDEDHSMPPPAYWGITSTPTTPNTPSPKVSTNVTEETITLGRDRNADDGDVRAFSVTTGTPTSNAFGDRDRYLYRSFHQYVYTPQSQGNGKYAIERKHKVKKRDLLHVRHRSDAKGPGQEGPPELEMKRASKAPCESGPPTNRETRTATGGRTSFGKPYAISSCKPISHHGKTWRRAKFFAEF